MGATLKAVTTTEGVAPFAFSEAALAECRAIMARYPEGRTKSALIPILHIAQAGNDGWLSVPAMDAVAALMGIRGAKSQARASMKTEVARACVRGPEPALELLALAEADLRAVGRITGDLVRVVADGPITIDVELTPEEA